MNSLPAFDVALQQFRAFLADQGVAGDPLWIFRDDVILAAGLYRVRVPIRRDNAARVRALYEQVGAHARGVEFAVLCLLGGRPCCFIHFAGAGGAGTGLKVSVPTAPAKAVAVTNRLAFRLRKWREPRSAADALIERVLARAPLPTARLLSPARRR